MTFQSPSRCFMRANPGERATVLLSNHLCGGAIWGLGAKLTRWPKVTNTAAGYVQNKKVIQNVEIVGLAVARVDHPDSLGSGRCGRGQSAPGRDGPWRRQRCEDGLEDFVKAGWRATAFDIRGGPPPAASSQQPEQSEQYPTHDYRKRHDRQWIPVAVDHLQRHALPYQGRCECRIDRLGHRADQHFREERHQENAGN